MVSNIKSLTSQKANKTELITKCSIKSRAIDFLHALKKDYLLYLLLIPFVLWYIIFMYRPMWGLKIAFVDYNPFKGLSESKWVGLKYFEAYINSPYFFRTLKNTVLINLYGLIFGFPVPIILAILINEVRNTGYKKVVQTVSYLPHFISIVVIAGIVKNFLSPSYGIVNQIIELLGAEKIYFLIKPQYFRSIYTTMFIWKDAGFGAVIYISALSMIDVELFDSAVIDGANKLKQIIHITIPSILPTIIIMLILKIGSLLEVGYEAILLLYQPATYETSDVISTYVYRSGLEIADYSLATAVGLFNSAVGFILVYFSNKLSNKISQIGLW